MSSLYLIILAGLLSYENIEINYAVVFNEFLQLNLDVGVSTLSPLLQNSLGNPFVKNFIQMQTGINVDRMQETLSSFCK